MHAVVSLSLTHTHQINREHVGTFTPAPEGGYRDVVLLGECDEGVVRVCELCGWKDDLEMLVRPRPVGCHGSNTAAAASTCRGTCH